jgi:hypothetical protein
MLRQSVVIVTIVALPSYTLAQVKSGVRSGLQSGVQSGVRSGYNYPMSTTTNLVYRPAYSNCWRTTVVRGTRIIWNCQPYPPPSP